MIITNNSPSAGYVAWQDVVAIHKNISYNVDNGNSNKKYIWWDYTTPTELQESDTMPALEANDSIFILNDSGTAYLWGDWRIHGELIVAGSILLTALATMPKITGQFVFTYPGEISTGTNVTVELFASASLTITEVYASVKVAPVGADLICDINKNGTTIFTDQDKRPQIPDGDTDDTSDAPDVTALVEGDKLTLDIDQVGSGTAGEDLTVSVRFEQDTT